MYLLHDVCLLCINILHYYISHKTHTNIEVLKRWAKKKKKKDGLKIKNSILKNSFIYFFGCAALLAES